MLTCVPAPPPYSEGTLRCDVPNTFSVLTTSMPDDHTWLSQDWGDVPTWCAVVVAAAAAIYAARAYRLERGRDIAAERIELQSQANNVAFWIDTASGRCELFYKNSTNQVVEKTVMEIVQSKNSEILATYELGPIAPGDFGSKATDFVRFDSPVALRTTFRDAQGISWTRFAGKLEPEKDAEQPPWWKSLNVDWDMLLMAPVPAVGLVTLDAIRLIARAVFTTLQGVSSVVRDIVRAVISLFWRR